MKKEKIKKFIGLNFKIDVCNLKCSYCYVGTHGGKIQDMPYTIEYMRKAFSKKRLGGICFINICSNGETLIHPKMPEIIEMFLQEGHYVMVLTNGTLTRQIEKCLQIQENLLARLFFKISFHYEEMLRLNMLETEFKNIQMIKESPCSLTVEYITCDESLDTIEEMKQMCMARLGALPQLNIPRDERKKNLGIVSMHSYDNYISKWESKGFKSEFFDFRKQFFGKKYRDYCYTGERQLWINMATGYSHQCYHTPPLQDFMGEVDKPVKWLAVGNNCGEAHCYVTHSHITLGIVPYPEETQYRTTYDVIRNRKCIDGTEWIKPTYTVAFRQGVEQREHSKYEKKVVNILNVILKWYRRKYPVRYKK